MPAIPRDLAALQPGKFLKKEKNSLPKKNPLERIKKNSQKSQKFPPRIPGKFTTRRDCQGAAPTSSRKIQHSQKTNAWSLFTTRKTQGIPNLGKKRAGNGSHSQKKTRRRGLAPIPAASPKKKKPGFWDQRWENPGSSTDFNSVLSSFPLPRCRSFQEFPNPGSYSTLAAPGNPGRDPKEEIPKEFQEEWQ